MSYIELEDRIDYSEIDTNAVALVKLFNEIGLKTEFSCAGHKETDSFYIIFDNSVTDEDIHRFLLKFDKHYTHSPFAGQFVKWCRKISGELVDTWMYECLPVNRLAYLTAELDYETILSEYDRG